MRLLPGDGFLSQEDEVAGISGDQRPSLPHGNGELIPIGKLDVASLYGTDGVKASLAKPLGDPRGQVLIQVELHAVRTTPGSLAATASRVRAAFSSISVSIS